jgi:hypothetical protein
MSDQKGILSREEEKQLAKLADDKVVFENKKFELLDGYFFRLAITAVDDYGLDRLKEDYKVQAEALADNLFAKEWDKALMVIWDMSSDIIKRQLAKAKK